MRQTIAGPRIIETINFYGGKRSCSQDHFHAGGPNPCLGKDPKSGVCCSLGPEVLFPRGEGDKDVLKTVMSVMRHAMHRYLQLTNLFLSKKTKRMHEIEIGAMFRDIAGDLARRTSLPSSRPPPWWVILPTNKDMETHSETGQRCQAG